MKRPTFMTIHTDFVDFDSTCNQYDYAYSDYMKSEGLTDVPTLPRTQPRRSGQKQGTPRPPTRTARARMREGGRE